MRLGKVIYRFIFTLFVLAFVACKKDKPLTIYQGYDYFPNRAGHWIIYNVDSIYVDQIKATIDTFNYQIKEVMDSFYTDNTGARTQVILRYKRTLPDSTWTYEKTYTGNLNATNATRTEDGIKYVKLTFPVSANASWNGGAFNNSAGTNAVFPDWDQTNFQYTSVNAPLYLNWQQFDSTVTVLQLFHQDFTRDQYFVEQYAAGIGRIFKEILYVKVADSYPGVVFEDPNHPGQDSLWVQSDYWPLVKNNEIEQASIIYTETYVSSGN